MRRFLKWFFGIVLVLLLFTAIAPFFFKDKIIETLKSTINKEVNAKIDWKGSDLTLFSTFPYFTLELNELTVDGTEDFEGVTLAKIETISLSLNLQSVLSGNYSVEKIAVNNSNFHVLVLEDGSANYDITRPSEGKSQEVEEPSPFSFHLKHYEINNTDVTYDDKSLNVFTGLKGLNHSGEGVFEGDIYDLKTKTEAESVTIGYEGVNYLSRALTDAKCDLEMNLSEWIFTFKENNLKLNEINLGFDGWFKMTEEFYEMDIAFKSNQNTFSSLLSLVPGAYTPDFGDVKTDGLLALSGKLFGKYSESSYPGFNLNLDVKNAYFQYPELPAKMEKINIKTLVDYPGGSNLDKLVVDIQNFELAFLENTIKLSFFTTNAETNPFLKSAILANVDLGRLTEVIPLEKGDNLNGKLISNIELEGNYSAIEQEKYDEFKALGDIQLSQMNYSSKSDGYNLEIDSMLFRFSPEQLELAEFSSSIGKSDVSAKGVIDNYLQYFMKDDPISGSFNVSSNYFNLDELIPEEEEVEVAEDSTYEYEIIPIPKNINFVLNTNIKTLVYDSIPLSNVAGVVKLENGIAYMENVEMSVFEGSILMNGNYNTQNIEKPTVAFDYDILNLDINQSAKYFNTIEKLAPVAKSTQGKFSTQMNFNSELGQDMYPVYETMNGKGNLRTNEVIISDFKPLVKLADVSGLEKFKNQTIKDVYLTYEFKDGKVYVDPFDVKLGNISANVKGTTSFQEEIDYDIKLDIPKSELGSATSLASDAASKLSSLTGKEISSNDNLKLNVFMTGTVSDPKISTDLKDQGKELISNVADSVKTKVKEEVEEQIDDAKEKVDEEIKTLLAEAERNANKVRSEGKTAANKIRKEGKVAADKVRAEAKTQADALIKKAGKDPVKKRLAQESGKKLIAEAEKKATAIETEAEKKAKTTEVEANKKADKIMADAYAKADALRGKGDL